MAQGDGEQMVGVLMSGWGRGAVLALGMLLLAPAWADEQFTFSVPYAANLDMDPARLAALLAASEVQVELNYEPLLAIPGWTGRMGYCAHTRFHVCIKKNWHSVVLDGAALQRSGDSLSVSMPKHRWFGVMPYRINRTVRITLPPVWPGDLPGNIDIYDISQGRGQQPAVDMHLPAPYVAVGVYRLDASPADASTATPYTVPPCDATLELGPQGRPQVHPAYQAAANEEWLRRLTDSPWWAAQIPGVRNETLAGLPPALASSAPGSQVLRVALSRGDTYTHIRARLPGLPGGSCPGTTAYEFSWLNGRLMAASQTANPDLDGPDQCPLGTVTQEALWWQGKLVSYTGPRVAGGDVTEWTQWKLDAPACLGQMDPTVPDVSGLEQAASQWWQYNQQAVVAPVVEKK